MVSARFALAVTCEGATAEHFAFCPHGMVLSGAGDYTLEAGDALFVHYGCILAGYYSDSSVAASVRKLTEPRLETCYLLGEADAAAVRLLCPEALASEVQGPMAWMMVRTGLYAFPHGHLLGIEMRDYRILVPDRGRWIRDDFFDLPPNLALWEGMVLNVDASLFQPGISSLHREHSFLMTENGRIP